MKTLVLSLSTGALLFGCTVHAPPELVTARLTYQRATSGPALKLVPAELHKAKEALSRAEESFKKEGDQFRTRDLAYVATRKAQMAETLAEIDSSKGVRAASDKAFTTAQTQIVANTKQRLSDTQKDLAKSETGGAQSRKDLAASEASGEQARKDGDQAKKDLAASEQSGQRTAGELTAERAARIAAEKVATDALAALAKLGEVKQEERGLVITLSGSVLFASAKSELLPAAQTRLNQVAEALLATKERSLVVEGHTDSVGADSYNVDLSQRRANAVREYLMSRGYSASLIVASGLGKVRPIASNKSADGRANNRRVEIVIQRAAPVSSR